MAQDVETAFFKVKQAFDRAFNDPKWKTNFIEVLSGKLEDNARKELDWTSNLKDKIVIYPAGTNLIFETPIYGLVIDKGRKPNSDRSTWPPLEPIKEWCKLKGIPEEAAVPIRNSIGSKGIKSFPKPWVDKVFQVTIADEITKMMVEEFEKTVNS